MGISRSRVRINNSDKGREEDGSSSGPGPEGARRASLCIPVGGHDAVHLAFPFVRGEGPEEEAVTAGRHIPQVAPVWLGIQNWTSAVSRAPVNSMWYLPG